MAVGPANVLRLPWGPRQLLLALSSCHLLLRIWQLVRKGIPSKPGVGSAMLVVGVLMLMPTASVLLRVDPPGSVAGLGVEAPRGHRLAVL